MDLKIEKVDGEATKILIRFIAKSICLFTSNMKLAHPSTFLGKLSTRFRSVFMGIVDHSFRSAFMRPDVDPDPGSRLHGFCVLNYFPFNIRCSKVLYYSFPFKSSPAS